MTDKADRIIEAEVTVDEYINTLEGIIPLVKGNKRLGFLFAYMNQVAHDFPEMEGTPQEQVAIFAQDMMKISELVVDGPK